MKKIKQAKNKNLIYICLIGAILLLASIIFYGSVSYFTATARHKGTLNFATLELDFVDSGDQTLTNQAFQQTYVKDLLPGSSIDINNIKVKNSGSTSAYVLTCLKVNITKTGVLPLYYEKWFNLTGNEVDITNFATNSTQADLISAGESKNISLQFVLPGEDITDDYKQANVSVNLTAEAIQSKLPDAAVYQSESLYAAYKIYSNKYGIFEGRRGVNLLNINEWFNYFESQGNPMSGGRSSISNNKITLTQTGSLCYTTTYASNNLKFFIPVEKNTNYVFSWTQDRETEEARNGLFCFINNEQNSTYGVYDVVEESAGNNRYFVTVNTGNGYSYLGICLGLESVGGSTITYSNFQLEKGTSPTSYESYAPFVHEPLRKIGDVSDALDTETKTITRNINVKVFDGSESWTEYTASDRFKNTYFIYIGNSILEYQTSYCTHFTNVNRAWANSIGSYGYYSDHTINNVKYFCSDKATIEEWKLWFKEQYDKGSPVMLFYILQTSTTKTY